MKQIIDISELTTGTQIVHFDGDKCSFWEYLGPHPKNPKYVLLLESLSQNAIKQYIPSFLNNSNWYIDYTFEEIYEKQKEWHLKRAGYYETRIKDEQSKKAKENSSKANQEG